MNKSIEFPMKTAHLPINTRTISNSSLTAIKIHNRIFISPSKKPINHSRKGLNFPPMHLKHKMLAVKTILSLLLPSCWWNAETLSKISLVLKILLKRRMPLSLVTIIMWNLSISMLLWVSIIMRSIKNQSIVDQKPQRLIIHRIKAMRSRCRILWANHSTIFIVDSVNQ